MATTEPSVFDHIEYHPQEDAMSPSASDDEYFQPSLRSLMDRDQVPPEHDAESVTSVRTVSDAETVSDQTEGFDMVGDQAEERDNINDTFDDFTPDEVNEAKRYTGTARTQPRHVAEEEEDELRLSTNSDRTLKPSKASSDSGSTATSRILRGPGDFVDNHHLASSTLPDAKPVYTEYVLRGFHLAPNPFRAPDRPLRVMLVADISTEQAVKTSIVLKIMSAIAQSSIDGHSIIIVELKDIGLENTSSTTEYRAANPKTKTPISVLLDHVIEIDLAKERLAMKGGSTVGIAESQLPDLAVFYHNEKPIDTLSASMKPTFPATISGSAIAHAFRTHNVPLLELRANNAQLLEELSCVTGSTEQDRDFFHVRMVHETVGKKGLQVDSKPSPVFLQQFTHYISNEDVSRHLAFISNQGQGGTSSQTHHSKSLTQTMMTKWWTVFLPLFLLATGLVTAHWMQMKPVDASTALTMRRDLLQASLDKWGLRDVNASTVLRYPTTTTILSGTPTSQVAFPTAMDVVVTRPDQLFVSLPKNYGRSISLGVLKNGKKLQVQATSLLDVVTLLSLEPEEAHGRVSVNVVTSNKPPINETFQVDLGNRLLQRATYEKAANRMQQTVQRDVSEVHSAAMAFQNAVKSGACSAANASASGVVAVRNGLFASALGAAHRLSDGYRFTANTTTKLARGAGHAVMAVHGEAVQDIKGMGALLKNTTSNVGAFLKNRVPSKTDFVRARKNSLKLRAKLQGKPIPSVAVPTQPAVRKNRYLSAVADIAETPSRLVRQCRKLLHMIASSQQAPDGKALHSTTTKAARKSAAKDKKMQSSLGAKTGDEHQCKNRKVDVAHGRGRVVLDRR